jgi:hypothetical protein
VRDILKFGAVCFAWQARPLDPALRARNQR